MSTRRSRRGQDEEEPEIDEGQEDEKEEDIEESEGKNEDDYKVDEKHAEQEGSAEESKEEDHVKDEDDDQEEEKADHEADEDDDGDKENDDEDKSTKKPSKKRHHDDEIPDDLLVEAPPAPMDPEILKQQDLIEKTPRTTELEHALYECLMRKESQVERLSGEITKLKAFISKRKQTYKRKRKDEGAPTRALSAYNIFVQDRFSKLAKENEQALKSSDSDAQLKRVPPASLVASTGNQWKELSAEEKTAYEERYVKGFGGSSSVVCK
jgi:hypothetical protein